MNRNEAIDLVRSICPAEADIIIPQLLPSARISLRDAGASEETQSHFGGLPSAPEGTRCPYWDSTEVIQRMLNRFQARQAKHPNELTERVITGLKSDISRNPTPLAFVAQIDLADVQGMGLDGSLPKSGSLLFFYDPIHGGFGFDPAARGSSAVLYVPESAPVKAMTPPSKLPADWRYKHAPITFRHEWTIPLVIREDEFQLNCWEGHYKDLWDALVGPVWEKLFHRLMGHPVEVQGDMRLQCQLAANGVYCGNPESYKDPRVESLRSGAGDWRLLLQLDSEDAMNWMWGDCGRVYYWIRRDDLAARDFDRVWCIMQCG